jgi:hypothetical protein
MVVNYRAMSNANYAIRGFCPNVLALKAVLTVLDVPGPQRRIANRYALTDTGLVPASRLIGSKRDCCRWILGQELAGFDFPDAGGMEALH